MLLRALQEYMMKIDGESKLQPALAKVSIEISVERYLENRATPERLRKGSDFRVLDGMQRLCGPISALHRSGEIDDSHVAAADRWYRDYVLGVVGARDPDSARSGKVGDYHAGMLSRVAACTRYRGVRDALGLCTEVRLRLLLLDELSFSAIAERLMPKDVNGRKKVAAQMVFLLEQLAEHYDALDKGPRLTRSAAKER